MAKKLIKKKSSPNGRGGPREGAGRKGKPDKAAWGYVTCSLKKETINRLREGAASIYIGEFLQQHLDNYPPPTREEFLASNGKPPPPAQGLSKHNPPAVAFGAGRTGRAAANAERRARQMAELSTLEQKLVKEIHRGLNKRDHARKTPAS